MSNLDYRNLGFYKVMKEVVCDIYSITKLFPKEEQGFTGLVNQMRRASVSAVSNLAEATSRKEGELLHFLAISLGSLKELEAQVDVSYSLDFIQKERFDNTMEKISLCIGKLYHYMQRVEQTTKTAKKKRQEEKRDFYKNLQKTRPKIDEL